MKALEQLERLGYLFTVEGDAIRYTHYGERPAKEEVRPFLQYLKNHKDELLLLLQERTTLLDQMEIMDPADWCRQWADLATRAGWPCTNCDSWADWLEEVAQCLSSPAQEKNVAG